MNIGKKIKDGYCGGCFGRRYDLAGSTIEEEGTDWVVIRTNEGTPEFASFEDEKDKQESIDQWCSGF